MKICRRCDLEKPIEDYYKHKKMLDGHLNVCKSCVKDRSKKRHYVKREDPEWMESERARGREKAKRLYRGVKQDSEVKRKSMVNYRNKYPEKYKAKIKSQRMSKPKGFNNHHWSYKEEHWKDVIQIESSTHQSFHRFIIYDQEHFQYRTIVEFNDLPEGILLNTKSIHIEYFEFIKANYEF